MTTSLPTNNTKNKKVKRPFQNYDLVEVIWDDAAGLGRGWMDHSLDPPKPWLVISVGFLVNDGLDHIIIAQDTDLEGSHNGRTQIPRGMIRKMKVLRKKDVKQPIQTDPKPV